MTRGGRVWIVPVYANLAMFGHVAVRLLELTGAAVQCPALSGRGMYKRRCPLALGFAFGRVAQGCGEGKRRCDVEKGQLIQCRLRASGTPWRRGSQVTFMMCEALGDRTYPEAS